MVAAEAVEAESKRWLWLGLTATARLIAARIAVLQTIYITSRRRPAACHDQLRDLLAISGSVDSPYCGPAYAFMVPVRPDEDARLVDLERRAVLRPILDEWVDLPLPELRRIQPLAAVFDHGELAALCWSSRLTDQAAEAGIKTLPPFRGRGYAVRAARTWAAAVQRSGRMALYSTSWDNLASQAVAGKLGLHCYGVDLSFG